MGTISISELSRNASSVVDGVETSGRPTIVTNHGRPVAALIPIDQEQLEDWVLAHAPEFVASMAAADEDLRRGRTRSLDEVLAEPSGPKSKGGRRSALPLELEGTPVPPSGVGPPKAARRARKAVRPG